MLPGDRAIDARSASVDPAELVEAADRAAMLLVREAGGFVTDTNGNDKALDDGAVVAGNQTILQELTALLTSSSAR